MIGEAGLTPTVVREVDAALRAHELIKVRVLGDDRAARKDLVAAICSETGAQPVQQIGKILVVYRERPAEEAKKTANKRPRRKLPRRTKRSYQAS
jgi:putative YhbY family RNA-binding protein